MHAYWAFNPPTRCRRSPSTTSTERPRPAAPLRLLIGCLLLLAGICRAAPAADRLDIQIRGVEPAIEANVRAFLSLSARAAEAEIDERRLRQLFARIEIEAPRALAPFGYYAPVIDSHLTRTDTGWLVEIEIEPGPPVILQEVVVEVIGPARDAPEFRRIIEQPLLLPGARLVHANYDLTKDRLLAAAQRFGYLEARFERNVLQVDPQARIANAYITFLSGPRYVFGSMSIDQDVINEDLFRRYLRFREGEPFDAELLLASNNILYDTGFFSLVDIVPRRQEAADGQIPVNIAATAGKKHRWGFGIGWGSDTRLRYSIAWTNRRMNRWGHSLTASLQWSEVRTTARVRHIIPVGDPALERVINTLATIEEEPGDVESRRTEVGSALNRVHGPWQSLVDLFFINEESDFGESTQHDSFFVPGFGLARSYSDDKLNPSLGFRVQAKVSGSSTALGAGADFTRLEGNARLLLPLGARNSLLLRGQGGMIFTGGFSDLSVSQRFFAGGENSVRGYNYKEISPRDRKGQRVGGRNLLTGTVEFTRRLFQRWGAAVFVDAGNAFDAFDDFEVGAGLGIRWFSPVGPVRIDIARSVTEPDKPPRIYLSIGPQL